MEGIHVSKIKKKKNLKCWYAVAFPLQWLPNLCLGAAWGGMDHSQTASQVLQQQRRAPLCRRKDGGFSPARAVLFLQAPDEHKPSRSAAASQERSTEQLQRVSCPSRGKGRRQPDPPLPGSALLVAVLQDGLILLPRPRTIGNHWWFDLLASGNGSICHPGKSVPQQPPRCCACLEFQARSWCGSHVAVKSPPHDCHKSAR